MFAAAALTLLACLHPSAALALPGVRVNKVLTAQFSRREADRLVAAQRVRINGEMAAPGARVVQGDVVTLDGRAIDVALGEDTVDQEFVYLKYWKPRGITCTTDRRIAGNIIDAVGRQDVRLFTVGRLDKDSEGLILLTNDGRLVNSVSRAAGKHEKVYEVTVDRPMADAHLRQLARGVVITTTAQRDRGPDKVLTAPTRPCVVERTNAKGFRIVLTEGRNRQIRRMCQAIGFRVVTLFRRSVMAIEVGDLPGPGSSCDLGGDELDCALEAIAQAASMDGVTAGAAGDETVDGGAVPTTPPSVHGNHQGGRSVRRVDGKLKKVRQHVNPLKSVHMKKLALPARWVESHFARPEQPLHIDIGSARGLFCLDLAADDAKTNVLGLEIRGALADAATADATSLGLGNAAFLACNANSNFEHLLALAEAEGGTMGPLRSVSIQFPDPWFKSRHHKRRVVQPELCQAIAHRLAPDGWLFVQSDVLELAQSARETIEEAAGDVLSDVCGEYHPDSDDAWVDAPKPQELLAVATERERAGESLGRPTYRVCFRKSRA